MSLFQSHQNMLKRFMKEELFMNEFKKRSYMWDKIEKKLDWAGGIYEVPVKQNSFSTVQMGSLAPITDIAEWEGAVGTINQQQELIMTAIFREADLTRQAYSEQTYLEKVPEMVEDLSRTGVEQLESGFFKGAGVLSYVVVDGTSAGVLGVDRPDYFQPNQKVEIFNGGASVDCYVSTVDINTGLITLLTARPSVGGGTAVNLSAYTVASNAKVRIVGASTGSSFLDLRTALLPASLGGSDTLYGLNKASYLPLQASRYDGSGYTATTILQSLIKNFFAYKKLGRGEASEIWVTPGMFANICIELEQNRRFTVTDRKAGFGFNSISLVGNEGEIKIVALRHMPTDVAVLVDFNAMKFAGMPIKKNLYGEAGIEYFVDRSPTGVSFVTDIVLRGDFVINPSKLGIIYNIPAAVSA